MIVIARRINRQGIVQKLRVGDSAEIVVVVVEVAIVLIPKVLKLIVRFGLELWSDSYHLFGYDELRFLAFYDFGDAYNHTLLVGEDPSVDLGGVGFGLRYSMQPNIDLRVEYAWQTAGLVFLPTPRERFHVGVVVSH